MKPFEIDDKFKAIHCFKRKYPEVKVEKWDYVNEKSSLFTIRIDTDRERLIVAYNLVTEDIRIEAKFPLHEELVPLASYDTSEVETEVEFVEYTEKPSFLKSLFKIIFKGFLVCCCLVMFIGMFAGSNVQKKSSAKVTATPRIRATSTVPIPVKPTKAPTSVPTTKPTKQPTAEPTKQPTEAPTTRMDLNTITETIKGYFSGTFDICKVEVDETSVVIQIGMTGFADYFAGVKAAGTDKEYEEYAVMKSSLSEVVNELVEQVKSYGMDDPMVMLSLVNDKNQNLTMLSIVNGYVVYDGMAD